MTFYDWFIVVLANRSRPSEETEDTPTDRRDA